jgi:putative tryptophan/tyrosine transport system substrate-binding protein
MNRREFIAGVGGTAASTIWLPVARAQQAVLPVVALINVTERPSATTPSPSMAAFRAGLGAFGYVEGQNVSVEYHWLESQYDRLPPLLAALVRRRVAVIAAGNPTVAVAAKTATATIPIVFGVGGDPVALGLVASLARPGGNATGINFLVQEAVSKRLGLLHELVPKASRVAVLINPKNIGSAEVTLQEARDAGRVIGLPIYVVSAGTSSEIETAFASLVRERIEALVVQGDGYFTGRRVQFAALTTRYGISTAFTNRDLVEAGGLMSYGTNFTENFRQIGTYTGQILKGANPADLPVVQSTKFEFVINMRTARPLGLTVPPQVLAVADQVIE